MSNVKIGFVKYKNEKEFRGKTLFSIKFEGDNELYRMGDEDSVDELFKGGTTWDDFKEGDAVKVRYEEDRKGNFNVDLAKVLDEGDDEYPKKARGGRGNGGGRGGRGGRGGSGGRSSGGSQQGGVDWEAKDARITLLSVQDRALERIKFLVENDAVKLPAKTKTEDRREVIQGLIDVEAARLYRQAYDVEGFLANAGEHTDAPAKAPKDDDGFDDDQDGADSNGGDDDDF